MFVTGAISGVAAMKKDISYDVILADKSRQITR